MGLLNRPAGGPRQLYFYVPCWFLWSDGFGNHCPTAYSPCPSVSVLGGQHCGELRQVMRPAFLGITWQTWQACRSQVPPPEGQIPEGGQHHLKTSGGPRDSFHGSATPPHNKHLKPSASHIKYKWYVTLCGWIDLWLMSWQLTFF